MSVEDAPKPVQDTFEALRQELGKKLSLHLISNHYYVYEYETVRDQARRKTIVKTYYIGHITKEGKYISKEQRRLENMEARSMGHQMQVQDDAKYDEKEAIALRNLSMNGRMSMNMLSKRIGMSVTGTRHFVKRLEEKYKIRYIIELNEFKLGYQRYIAFIKFNGTIPTRNKIISAFKDNPNTILLMATKGTYDLVAIFYLNNDDLLTYFLYRLRNSSALNTYTWEAYVTIVSKYDGTTIELREPFFELLKNKTTGVKEKTTNQYTLTKNEYLLITALSKNGKEDFKTIDERYGLGRGRSNYMFYKLRQKGVVNRITISIDPPGLKYNAIFLMQTNNYKNFGASRKRWLQDTLVNISPFVNKYIFIGDIAMPDGVFHMAPIFRDEDFSRLNNELTSIKGTNVNTLIITDLILGSLCYRNFDNNYYQSNILLADDYNIKVSKKETYG